MKIQVLKSAEIDHYQVRLLQIDCKFRVEFECIHTHVIFGRSFDNYNDAIIDYDGLPDYLDIPF